jgi:hypothetical protein
MVFLPKFTKIDESETLLEYKNYRFMLVERSRGVFGLGKAVQLYRLDGFDKKHIKELGWTKSDNHEGQDKGGSYLSGVVTYNQCKDAAVKYIDTIV